MLAVLAFLVMSGIIRVTPVAMTTVEDDISEDFDTAYGESRLPCGRDGKPRDVA